MTHLVFFANSGHILDTQVWIVFLTSMLQFLDLANPSWLSRLLPSRGLRRWLLCSPQLTMASWYATYSTADGRTPCIVGVMIQVIIRVVGDILGVWILSRTTTAQIVCLMTVVIATVLFYVYLRYGRVAPGTNAVEAIKQYTNT